jgi:hypothetical protein
MAVTLMVMLAGGCVSDNRSGSVPRPGSRGSSLLDAQGGEQVHNLASTAIVYHVGATPKVKEITFPSTVTVNRRSEVMSLKFVNRVGQSSQSMALLAISGGTAGFGIYDWAGTPMMEFSKGKVSGDGRLVTFEYIDANGKSMVEWLLGDDSIVSIINNFDKMGNLFHVEVTTYHVH